MHASKPLVQIEEGGAGVPRVLVLTEHLNATFWIYLGVPLSGMAAQGRVAFAALSQAHFGELADASSPDAALCRLDRQVQPDVVVLSRCAGPHAEAIVRFFRRLGVRTVYYIDDDLLDVPQHLGAELRREHGSEAVVRQRRAAMSAVDAILATTDPLADSLRRHLPDACIEAAGGAPFWHEAAVPLRAPASRPPCIGYVASRGHAEDLGMVLPALEALLARRTDMRLELYGTISMPASLARFAPRVAHRPVARSYREFLAALGAGGWTLGIAPLRDNHFNRCRTAVKYLEYSAAGIPTLASDLPVYAQVIEHGRSGWLAREDEWLEALRIVDDAQQCAQVREAAREARRRRFPPAQFEARLMRALLPGMPDSAGRARRRAWALAAPRS